MRKTQKRQVEEFLGLLDEAHGQIRKALDKKNLSDALELLKDCQDGAISLGGLIEKVEGEELISVHVLEEYCEAVYQIYEEILLEKIISPNKVYKLLRSLMKKIRSSINSEIRVRTEVVFLPYKVSMWDSLESIWKSAAEDPECEAYVIPIPYYGKNPDGNFREMYYEGGQYPDYVPVVWYEDYDFEMRKPDMIFFHNPYDDYNYVTSVHPAFYSSNLKKYTDNLVYVPYYVLPKSIPEHFVLTQGVFHADWVFVQNPLIRKQYIDILEKNVYKGFRQLLEKKIVSLGSPKTDRFLLMLQKRNIPELWKEKIGNKKVVFFNTNVSLLLNNGEYFDKNLYRIFRTFEEFKEQFIVLWREHPLTMETLHSMKPELLEKYLKLKEDFTEQEWGILDTTDDPHLAMSVSDCYYGAGGSLITVYAVTGRPMMVTEYNYPKGISENEISKQDFYDSIGNRTFYREKHINSLRIFLENYDEIQTFESDRLEKISRWLMNLDGTAGAKIYDYVKNEGKI